VQIPEFLMNAQKNNTDACNNQVKPQRDRKMYIENAPSHFRHPILSTSYTARLLGFNVYLRHPELMRVQSARARTFVVRSFAASRRPDSGVTYLLKFYSSREIETTPARTARSFVFARARKREGERSGPRIKRRLTIVHSVSRHHRVSSAAAGRCTKTAICGAGAICVRRARNGRGIRSSRRGGS
jgi:hypothetical protein